MSNIRGISEIRGAEAFSRRGFLKAAGVAAVATAGVPLLTSCGGGGSGSGISSYSMWSVPDTVPVMRYFAEKYKAVNKDFRVSITEVPAGLSYRAKIVSASAAGQLPDLIDAPMQYGSDFASYNLFEPLDKYLPSSFAKDNSLYERIWEWFNTESLPAFDGDSYTFGSPYSISVVMPTYRADLFREAGVAFPRTWDDLVDVGKKLTNAPDRYALSIPTSGDLVDEFHPYLMQAGVQYVDSDLKEAFPDRQAAYTAFEFYRDIAVKHKIAPTQTPDRYADDPVQRLVAGQVAMTSLFTYSISAFRETVKDLKFGADADWFAAPFWSGPAGSGGLYNCNALHIRRGVKNAEPAAEFFTWLLKPEQQTELFRRFNRPPINTSVWGDFKDDPVWPVYEASINSSERAGGMRGWKLAEFAINRGVERIVLGGEPVQPVVDQTATDIIQALQNA